MTVTSPTDAEFLVVPTVFKEEILAALRSQIGSYNLLANSWPEGSTERAAWFSRADHACAAYDAVSPVPEAGRQRSKPRRR